MAHFHAMLIGAGAEDGFVASENLPSLQDICKNKSVEMTHMGCLKQVRTKQQIFEYTTVPALT